MRISDWSSDVCSSVLVYTGCLRGGVHDLDATVLGPAILARRGAGRALFAVADHRDLAAGTTVGLQRGRHRIGAALAEAQVVVAAAALVGVAFQGHARGRTVTQVLGVAGHRGRSEEHTSELQSLKRISYAVFCLKKKK